jgi:hypothetical protein
VLLLSRRGVPRQGTHRLDTYLGPDRQRHQMRYNQQLLQPDGFAQFAGSVDVAVEPPARLNLRKGNIGPGR